MGANETHATEDEAEAVAQLQALGFKWSDAWSHWQLTHNGAYYTVYTPMSGWWATCIIEQTQFETPLGVTHPLDVVEWVRREMDAND